VRVCVGVCVCVSVCFAFLGFLWVSSLAYPNFLGTKGFVVVVVVGHQNGKDCITSASVCQAMRISWKLWKEKSLLER
jgi:hypothetical protein